MLSNLHLPGLRTRDCTSELALLLFNVFRELPWADFPAVHVALRIHRHALRRAGSLQFERVRNTVQDLTVFEAADPDTSLPSWVWGGHAIGFGVGYIDQVVSYVDTARATELL